MRTDYTQINKNLNLYGHITVGFVASFNRVVILQPLDTIKAYVMNNKPLKNYKILYRGTSSNLLGLLPIHCLLFLSNGVIIKHFINKNNSITNLEKTISGICSAILVSPFSTAYQRVTVLSQTQNLYPKNIFKQLKFNNRNYSLFKGYLPNLLRDVKTAAALFGISDIFKDSIYQTLPNDCSSKEILASYLGKFSSGAIAGALSTPLDIIRCRMQADIKGKYPKTFSTFKQLIQSNGAKVFFNSVCLRSLYVGIGVLIMGISKEKLPPHFLKFKIFQERP